LDPSFPDDAMFLALKATSLAQLARQEDESALKARQEAREEATRLATTLEQVQDNVVARAWAAIIQKMYLRDEPEHLMKLIETMNKGLKARPQDPYLNYYAGNAYARIGERGLAIEAFRLAVDNNRYWYAPPRELSRVLLETGQLQEAYDAASLASREA